MIILSISFFITAILYACVGFGGGSTYSALLVLAETDYRILPVISLLCNLVVVSGGVWRFARGGHIDFKAILPWVAISVPAAYIGGMIELSEMAFIGVLGVMLLLSSFRMLRSSLAKPSEIKDRAMSEWVLLPYVIGGGLGFIAGLVGIGGGIFLAPVLYLIKWGSVKSIAGTCSVFIFLNSVAGLVGQLSKLNFEELSVGISPYLILFPAVFVGGQIGSYMGAVRLNARIVQLMTAMLILYVSLRLLSRLLIG